MSEQEKIIRWLMNLGAEETADEIISRDEHIERLRAELEVERQRLAACGVAALGYFEGCKDEYRSASLEDVLRLHAENATLREQLSQWGIFSEWDSAAEVHEALIGLQKDVNALREALKNHAEEAAKMVNAEPVAIGWLCDDGGGLYAFFKNEDEDEMADFIAETEPLTVIKLFAAAPKPEGETK